MYLMNILKNYKIHNINKNQKRSDEKMDKKTFVETISEMQKFISEISSDFEEYTLWAGWQPWMNQYTSAADGTCEEHELKKIGAIQFELWQGALKEMEDSKFIILLENLLTKIK